MASVVPRLIYNIQRLGQICINLYSIDDLSPTDKVVIRERCNILIELVSSKKQDPTILQSLNQTDKDFVECAFDLIERMVRVPKKEELRVFAEQGRALVSILRKRDRDIATSKPSGLSKCLKCNTELNI